MADVSAPESTGTAPPDPEKGGGHIELPPVARRNSVAASLRAVRARAMSALSISQDIPLRERIHHVTFAWYTLT